MLDEDPGPSHVPGQAVPTRSSWPAPAGAVQDLSSWPARGYGSAESRLPVCDC